MLSRDFSAYGSSAFLFGDSLFSRGFSNRNSDSTPFTEVKDTESHFARLTLVTPVSSVFYCMMHVNFLILNLPNNSIIPPVAIPNYLLGQVPFYDVWSTKHTEAASCMRTYYIVQTSRHPRHEAVTLLLRQRRV